MWYVSICFGHVNYLRDYFVQNAEFSIGNWVKSSSLNVNMCSLELFWQNTRQTWTLWIYFHSTSPSRGLCLLPDQAVFTRAQPGMFCFCRHMLVPLYFFLFYFFFYYRDSGWWKNETENNSLTQMLVYEPKPTWCVCFLCIFSYLPKYSSHYSSQIQTLWRANMALDLVVGLEFDNG